MRQSSYLALALLLSALCVYAQEGSPPARWYETILVNGFLSTSYSYNFNRPDVLRNQLRVFDGVDNSFNVDVLELSIRRDVADAGEAGFRFDLTTGSSIPRVTRSSGMNSGDIDCHQMFLSYVVPVGMGLRVDCGRFITHLGYEVIEGYDGYNDNQSHSFLFGYAIPFTHTGLRVSYPFSGQVSASFMLVNGWDNAIDNNRSKTVCGQIGLTPVDGLSLLMNAAYGPERDNNNSDNRMILDVVGTYVACPVVTIGINADYGREQHVTLLAENATWQGVAAYVRLNLLDGFALCFRAEQFEDRKGVRTGDAQILREATFSPEYKPNEHFVLRGDFRIDHSNCKVFARAGSMVNTQTTMSLNALFLY